MNEKDAFKFLLYRSWLANKNRMSEKHQRQLYGNKVQEFKVRYESENKEIKRVNAATR